MFDQRPKVFLGSSSESHDIVEALREHLKDIADVISWKDNDVFPPGQFVLESLLQLVPSFDFAVLVFGLDDLVTTRGLQYDAPRDNVVFELGLFMSNLERHRTFAIKPSNTGTYRILSDISGLNLLTYDEEPKRRPVRTVAQQRTREHYLRGALRNASEAIRKQIQTSPKRREQGTSPYLSAESVIDLRRYLFDLLSKLQETSEFLSVDNLGHDLGVTWSMTQEKLFNANFGAQNIRWRTLMVDPKSPAMKRAAGAGFSVQVAKSRIDEIPIACRAARRDLRNRNIEVEWRAYSNPVLLHGFLVNDSYLFLALAQTTSTGKLDTRSSPYWLYQAEEPHGPMSQPVAAFRTLFDYEWKRARRICAVRP